MKKEGFWKHNWSIIKFNKKFFLLLFAGLIVLYSFLYGLWKIPFIEFGIYRDSAVGISDYLFIFGISVFVSLFFTLWRHEKKQKTANSELAVGVTGGGVAGLVAGICPACQSVGLVALGTTFFSIPTAFLVPYLGLIKIISIGLLILVVYIKANSVYAKNCKFCIVQKPKKKNV